MVFIPSLHVWLTEKLKWKIKLKRLLRKCLIIYTLLAAYWSDYKFSVLSKFVILGNLPDGL